VKPSTPPVNAPGFDKARINVHLLHRSPFMSTTYEKIWGQNPIFCKFWACCHFVSC
jgi:hypothetical protein